MVGKMGRINNIKIIPKEDLFEELLKQIEKTLLLKKEIKIIDVGCGKKPYEKTIKKRLKKTKIEYTGIDFYSEKADIKIDLNREKIPFKKDYFDLIICTEVLEHLYNPGLIIKEMKRVCKKGGYIIITTPFLKQIHAKEHDYFRYTYNYYQNVFKEEKIIFEAITNTFATYIFYLLSDLISNKFNGIYKIVKYIQKPLDKIWLQIFPDKYITYSYYWDYGIVIRKDS